MSLSGHFSPRSVIVDGVFLSARLPDLSIVIMCDSKLPGTFHMDEVMQAGDSSHVKQLRAVQQTLSCSEPINIQFTSVGALPAPCPAVGFLPGDTGKDVCNATPHICFIFPSETKLQASAVGWEECSSISPTSILFVQPIVKGWWR